MLKSILFLTLVAGALCMPSLDVHAKTNAVQSRKSTFEDYFNGVEWITRDGVLSLSIDHKWIQLWEISAAFKMLEDAYATDAEWDNRDSLYAQFSCHVKFAPFKNPWNIEPSRTTTSSILTILNQCNPAKFYYTN